jgi:hypothetical protein
MFTNQVIIINVVDVISQNHQTIIAIMSCKFFVIHLVVNFFFYLLPLHCDWWFWRSKFDIEICHTKINK